MRSSTRTCSTSHDEGGIDPTTMPMRCSSGAPRPQAFHQTTGFCFIERLFHIGWLGPPLKSQTPSLEQETTSAGPKQRLSSHHPNTKRWIRARLPERNSQVKRLFEKRFGGFGPTKQMWTKWGIWHYPAILTITHSAPSLCVWFILIMHKVVCVWIFI